MEEMEKHYIEIEYDLGQVEKAEILGIIPSQRDDKNYIILTQDEEIGEEVNIIVGILYEVNGEEIFVEVEDDAEYEYVVSLMDKVAKGELNYE